MRVILTTPPGLSGIAEKWRRAAPPSMAYIFVHRFRILPEDLLPRTSQAVSPSMGSSPYLRKNICDCSAAFAFQGINMEPGGVDKGMSI